MTLEEFARIIGIARSTVYDLAKRGELPVPVIHAGRRLLISRALVERLLLGEGIPTPPNNAGEGV